jgi:hypothetical protein
MDALGVFGALRQVWPRLAAILVLAAFYFHPQFSTAFILAAAEERAQRITGLLDDALESTIADSRRQSSPR